MDKRFGRGRIRWPIILIVIIGLLLVRGHFNNMVQLARIDGLQLPEGTTVYLKTRITANDICWDHWVVEKVVRCEQGLYWFREYLKKHNSYEQLKGVNVCPFDVMDDMEHYCLERLKEPAYSEVREDGAEKYIIIEYWVYGARENQWRLGD